MNDVLGAKKAMATTKQLQRPIDNEIADTGGTHVLPENGSQVPIDKEVIGGDKLSGGSCIDECADTCNQLYTRSCVTPGISKCRLGENYHNITIGGKTCAIR